MEKYKERGKEEEGRKGFPFCWAKYISFSYELKMTQIISNYFHHKTSIILDLGVECEYAGAIHVFTQIQRWFLV